MSSTEESSSSCCLKKGVSRVPNFSTCRSSCKAAPTRQEGSSVSDADRSGRRPPAGLSVGVSVLFLLVHQFVGSNQLLVLA